MLLRTASGRICQISNSRRASYGHDQRIEVHGSKGLLRAGNQLETTVEVATEAGFRRAPAEHFFIERYRDAYVAEIGAFTSALLEGIKPNPSIEDGLRAQMLADAATQAHQRGEIVAIPQD